MDRAIKLLGQGYRIVLEPGGIWRIRTPGGKRTGRVLWSTVDKLIELGGVRRNGDELFLTNV